MLTVTQRVDLNIKIEASVPDKGYCEKKENCIVFFYSVSKQLKRLEYSRDAFLEVLKKHGEDFRVSFLTVYGPKGEPIQSERKVKVLWQEIEITQSLAHKIVTRHEFEVAARTIGILPHEASEEGGKVIPFYSNTYKAA